MRTPLLSLATLLLLLSSGTCLIAQNRIVAAPNAVELRKVWEKKGRDLRVDEYGTAMWGGIDLSGDGIADFAVYQATGDHPNTWHFYRGGGVPDTGLFWRVGGVSYQGTGVGNFFADQRRFMLFRDGTRVTIDDYTYFLDRLRLFEVGDSGIISNPVISIDQAEQETPIERMIQDIRITDINQDGVADIILILTGARVGLDRSNFDPRAQIWIYLGGPDFQLDSPSVVIYDTLDNGGTPANFGTHFLDVNGDGRTDLVSGGVYSGGVGGAVRIWFGDQNAPFSWAQRTADRTIITDDRLKTVGIQEPPKLGLYQLDLHPGIDLVGIILTDTDQYTAFIYLSSRDTIATRSFDRTNADLVYQLPSRYRFSGRAGYLNDSLRRVELVPLLKPPFFDRDEGMIFLSGGSQGPDSAYDAFLNRSVFSYVLGDVTGDGWDDYGAADPNDGVRATGIAIVYAGGPYIPLDDPTLNVHEEPVAGEAGGLFLWPNPVVDELNIAWRGDLRQMPARFEVYDARGALVAEGDVEPGRGKALWQCAGVASGHYVIVGYDDSGAQITAAPVIVQ